MSSDADAYSAQAAIEQSEDLYDHLPHPAGDNLLVLMMEVSAALQDPVHAAEARIERAVKMIQRLVRSTGKASPRGHGHRGGLAPWQIRRLTWFVNRHISESLCITDMAAVVRLSPHHFCRAFRVSLGESPHRYLLRCRVEQSEQLMRTTRLPLGQISAECGFSDQAHFTKVFSSMRGVSPGAWRRREAERSTVVELAVYGPLPSPPAALTCNRNRTCGDTQFQSDSARCQTEESRVY
jgi:AraC family transcriptional regulator